ncbi:MAG: hypothetical protein N2690_01980 [Rhodocyclaceae bacterium]|nr:hypothetical protein [Rhodocyclaceae bacterium]
MKRLLDLVMLVMLSPFILLLLVWMAADLLLEYLEGGPSCGPGSPR